MDLDALLAAFAKKLAPLVAAELANGNGHQPPQEPDKLVTVEQAASRLGVKVGWLYGHAASLPFTVRLPNSRAVRFSERGIAKWLERRAPK